MEFVTIKYLALIVGLIIAVLVKKKYPDFPNGKNQVAILVVGLLLASIAVFNLFIS